MACCNHNCNEGRTCPERIARMEQRDGGARIDHGQIVGYESAGRVPDPPPKPKLRDRFDPQAVAIVVGCALCYLGVYLASIWPIH